MLLEQLLKEKESPPMAFFEATAELLPTFERFYESRAAPTHPRIPPSSAPQHPPLETRT